MTHGIQRKFLSTVGATAAASIMFVAAGPAAAVICDLAATVGGGTNTLSARPPLNVPGKGWDVGDGQCNGDFTATTSPSFPGGALELGMRIEQRSVGQVARALLVTGVGDYLVQPGLDPTSITRAWWNFQHSIAYNGGIAALDELSFVIRTDAGLSVPSAPAFDMIALRPFIDNRNDAAGTATFSELYQTSQNPTFAPWFSSYDKTQPGAWLLTLAAVKAGQIASVSICAHTLGQVCAAAPAVYTCGAFAAPMDKVISVKKNNRVLPLKMVCTGNNPTAAPIVQVTKTLPSGEETVPADTYLSAGQGTDGNQFVFDGVRWNFNLQTKNFTGTGTYAITAVSGGGDLLVGAPIATFIVQ